MTNKKTITIVALIAILASLIGGFVVYAAISSQLDIRGSAEFQPESWSVKFKASSLSEAALTGGASIQTEPTLSDTVIEDFKIILTQPGDSSTYTFYIENTGTLDAILSTYTYKSPVCTGTGISKTNDEELICGSNLSYTLKYIGGDLATNNLSSGQIVTQNDRLKANTQVQLELKLAYSNDATEQPKNTVSIGSLGKTLIYTVDQS